MQKHSKQHEFLKYLVSFEDQQPTLWNMIVLERELHLHHVTGWYNVIFSGTPLDEYTNETQFFQPFWAWERTKTGHIMRNQFDGYLITMKNGFALISTGNQRYNLQKYSLHHVLKELAGSAVCAFIKGIIFLAIYLVLKSLGIINDDGSNNSDSNDNQARNVFSRHAQNDSYSYYRRTYTGHNLVIPKKYIQGISYDEQHHNWFYHRFYVDIKDKNEIKSSYTLEVYPVNVRPLSVTHVWHNLRYLDKGLSPLHSAHTNKVWHQFKKEQSTDEHRHNLHNTISNLKSVPSRRLSRIKSKRAWRQLQRSSHHTSLKQQYSNYKDRGRMRANLKQANPHESLSNNINDTIQNAKARLKEKETWFKYRHHLN